MRGSGGSTITLYHGLKCHNVSFSTPLKNSFQRRKRQSLKMVLAQPENKHVLKAFDLTGKVAAITGKDALANFSTECN